MKKLKFNYLLIGLLSLGLLASCGGSSNDDPLGNIEANIIGEWGATDVSILIDGVEYGDYLRQISAAAGVPLSDEEVNAFREEAELEVDQAGQIVEFVADGTFRSTYSDLGRDVGNWTISGNTLSLNSGDGSLLYTVENLTDDQLRLSFSGDGVDPVFSVVQEGKLRVVLYFIRI